MGGCSADSRAGTSAGVHRVTHALGAAAQQSNEARGTLPAAPHLRRHGRQLSTGSGQRQVALLLGVARGQHEPRLAPHELVACSGGRTAATALANAGELQRKCSTMMQSCPHATHHGGGQPDPAPCTAAVPAWRPNQPEPNMPVALQAPWDPPAESAYSTRQQPSRNGSGLCAEGWHVMEQRLGLALRHRSLVPWFCWVLRLGPTAQQYMPSAPNSERSTQHTAARRTIQAMATRPEIQVSKPTRQSPLAMGSPEARHVLRPLLACSSVTTPPGMAAAGCGCSVGGRCRKCGRRGVQRTQAALSRQAPGGGGSCGVAAQASAIALLCTARHAPMAGPQQLQAGRRCEEARSAQPAGALVQLFNAMRTCSPAR